MLIEADSAEEALKTLKTAAMHTNEYIGSHASGDPLVYRVEALPESIIQCERPEDGDW